MSNQIFGRKKPAGASGALAALLIAPRDFAYTVCWMCPRYLFFTYAGERCPFCDSEVEFISGVMPKPDVKLPSRRNSTRMRAGA